MRAPAGAIPHGVPDKVRANLEHELTLIAQLQYAPYFLTVYDIVRFARSQGILCQGRGSAANSAVCYLPRHHRGRSRPRRPAVRALHLHRAARAARHRRRFRARAARRGHPIYLRQIRPRARRHRRHRDLLSRPLGDPRGRQGLRPVRGHHRRAVVLDLGRWRRRGVEGCRHPHRPRPAQPAHAPDRGAGARDQRLPAPSVAACRRLRHHPQPARRSDADRQCARWTTAPSSNGTRTISTRSAS